MARRSGSQPSQTDKIDKKSLFGSPRTASTRTGQNHAETGLAQRYNDQSMAETGENVKPITTKTLSWRPEGNRRNRGQARMVLTLLRAFPDSLRAAPLTERS
jgi:hypothetical protein